MIICETERLRIRQFNEDDTDFIIELLNQDSFITNICDKGVRTTEQALEYLHSGPMKSYQSFGYGLSMVELKDSNQPIGMCGILKREQLEYPDLGYALLPNFCSKGYAFEAAAGLLINAVEQHQLDKILAVTSPDNEKSLGLLAKLGFEKKGEMVLYEGEAACILLEYVKAS